MAGCFLSQHSHCWECWISSNCCPSSVLYWATMHCGSRSPSFRSFSIDSIRSLPLVFWTVVIIICCFEEISLSSWCCRASVLAFSRAPLVSQSILRLVWGVISKMDGMDLKSICLTRFECLWPLSLNLVVSCELQVLFSKLQFLVESRRLFAQKF